MKWLRSICLPVALATSHSVAADSPVWKVSSDSSYLYVAGTIHLLSEADYPLPDGFERAYEDSEQLVIESDIAKLQSPQFQQTLLTQAIYTDGRTVKDVLTAQTYDALEQFLSERGVPIAGLSILKPGMLSMTLTMLELQRLGMAGAGVDQFFNQRASDDEKVVGKLETAEQQLAMLAQMGLGQEDELIAHTLREIEQLPTMMKSLKAAWRRGDNSALSDIALMPWKRDFPQVYESLLVDRNNAWIPQIEAMLDTVDVELIMVGALHLVGEDGVLAQLEAKGYTIDKL